MTLDQENELAKSFGYTCERDKRRGGKWCKFTDGPTVVWHTVCPLSGDLVWVNGEIRGGRYRDHQYYHTLEGALSEVGAYCRRGGGEYWVPIRALPAGTIQSE